MQKTKKTPNRATLRTLIRIARSAYCSADDLLLRSAEIELVSHGITLADLGIDTESENSKEVPRG